MKSTKKLINEPADAVTEFLEGYVSSMRHVQLLEGSPDVSQSPTIPAVDKLMKKVYVGSASLRCTLQINVVVNVAPTNQHKVAVISGILKCHIVDQTWHRNL